VAVNPDSMSKYSVVFDDMQHHYDCLIGTLPGIVYTLDEKGHFTYISDSVESTFGFSRQDLIGRHFSVIVHGQDLPSVSRDFILPRFEGVPTGNERAPKLFDERRSWPRRTADLQVHIRPKQGFRGSNDTVLKCRVNASGQYDQRERFCGTVGMMYDISEDKDVSFSFGKKRQYNAFELLTEAISHVFSNVFTGIYGNLQLIEMQLDKPEVFRGNIEAIKSSVENAVTLIRKLSRTVSAPQRCNGDGLGRIVTETADELFAEAELRYEYRPQDDIWPAESDADYLRHILRAVFLHVARSVKPGGSIIIRTDNVRESPVKLPRIDCGYIRICFEFDQIADTEASDSVSRVSSLERIASMALSFELLKKIGGRIVVSNSDHSSNAELFLPAIHPQS